MLKKDVKIGGVYTAKVSDKIVPVRIDSDNRHGGWNATNLTTKKAVRIKSAQRLRTAVTDGARAAKAEEATKNAKAAAETPQPPTSSPTGEVAAKAAACTNCGATEFDEDGDCAKCHEPQTAPEKEKARKPRAKKADPDRPKHMSGLDAAARVLAESDKPLNAVQIVTIAELKGYWKSPGGKTPSATVYSAILREIATKGDDARFRKVDRGHFAHR